MWSLVWGWCLGGWGVVVGVGGSGGGGGGGGGLCGIISLIPATALPEQGEAGFNGKKDTKALYSRVISVLVQLCHFDSGVFCGLWKLFMTKGLN